MKKTKYFFDTNFYNQWFLIDAKFRQEWHDWVRSEGPTTPEFAMALVGTVGGIYDIEFENPKIGRVAFQKEEPDEHLYFVEVKRQMEENYTFHFGWVDIGNGEPTHEYVLELIQDEDIGFNPDYETFNFYRIS